jgi:hypothetical protein
MSTTEILSIASALLVSLGGGGVIVIALSTWLGKLWASRILEQEKSALQHLYAEHQHKLNMSLHKHNVAATRIDAQRVEAIRDLYGALIGWHEAAIQIVAPNDFAERPPEQAPYVLAKYALWAKELRKRSEKLEQVAMRTAIYFSEETYGLIAKCGYTASMMSIEFAAAAIKDHEPGSSAHLRRVEESRGALAEKYSTAYEPARRTVVEFFRNSIDPTNAKT